MEFSHLFCHICTGISMKTESWYKIRKIRNSAVEHVFLTSPTTVITSNDNETVCPMLIETKSNLNVTLTQHQSCRVD